MLKRTSFKATDDLQSQVIAKAMKVRPDLRDFQKAATYALEQFVSDPKQTSLGDFRAKATEFSKVLAELKKLYNLTPEQEAAASNLFTILEIGDPGVVDAIRGNLREFAELSELKRLRRMRESGPAGNQGTPEPQSDVVEHRQSDALAENYLGQLREQPDQARGPSEVAQSNRRRGPGR